jgi:hypothetical protein
MQTKICEELAIKRRDVEDKRPEDERWHPQVEERDWRQEREDRKRYFEANFKYGSTTVLRHNGEFFFQGDIKHCGTDNIFFNARKIKSMIEANGQTMGHMNYNDPPTFSSKWDWNWKEKERKEIYRDDLYKFVGDEIVVAELIGTEPIGQIYKDEPCDSEDAAEPSVQKDVESMAQSR